VARFGYARLLLGATALAAVALGVIPLLRGFWPLVLAAGLMGASTGFTQPLTMNLVVESVAAEFWGMAIGIRQSVQRLATVISPIAFGLVTRSSGIESAFFLGALTLASALPIMTRATKHLRRPPDETTALREPAIGPESEGPFPRVPYAKESNRR
jgi:MFS family permease